MEVEEDRGIFFRDSESQEFNDDPHPGLEGEPQSTPNQQHKFPQNLKDFLVQLDDNHDSEDEGIEDYKIGGYHPVHIGEVLLNRYVVIQKLGWGHFSTVWLCKDFKFDTYVAVKIQKSSPQYMDAAFDEVQILQNLAKHFSDKNWSGKTRDDTKVVSLLNSFVHKSNYGNHFCMVFEILRCNLFDIVKRYNYEGVPLNICQEICKQILQGLDYLHRICSIIHTDLKPENVMLCLSEDEVRDIVQNGQITKNQLFSERTEIFQRLLGITNTEPKEKQDVPKEAIIPNELLTKAQKKNLKKKKNKQKQKQKQRGGQHESQEHSQQGGQHVGTFEQLFDLQKGKIAFNRGDKLKLPLDVKIADLGNACWKHYHFSTEIQTRQYRSPEVILGQAYNETADIWSLACMMYEMLTGDLLFQPKKDVSWTKNDCHLVQMQELVGRFHPDFSLRGKKSSHYFNKDGSMKRISHLQKWPLDLMLTIKHKIKPELAKDFADFLAPMLIAEPENRISAFEALKHPWLSKQLPEDYKIPDEEYLPMRDQFQIESQNPDYNLQPPIGVRNSEPSGEDPVPEESFVEDGIKYANVKLIDKSFTDLGYIGYCDGIELSTLDSKNWQFKD